MEQQAPQKPVVADHQEFDNYLELLAVVGQDFATSLDIDETVQLTLSRIVNYLDAEAASLFMLENDDTEIVCRVSVGPSDIVGLRLKYGQGIVGQSISQQATLMVRDVTRDANFLRSVDEKTGFTTRSILCAPMSLNDVHIGAIEVINKRVGEGLFAEGDRDALRVLAASAALAIHNATLTKTLITQQRLQRELELVAELQLSLLPDRRETDFPVHGVNVPARTVSGDFFDFFALPDGRICFDLGDVAGKGIQAALLMAKASSLVRCLGKSVHHPGDLLGLVNREICETASRGMFVTLVVGIYDPADDSVILANAGHEPALLVATDGSVRDFAAMAPPVGVSADLPLEQRFPEITFALDGGSLYLFTDGVTEGSIDGGAPLGPEGVRDLLRELSVLPAANRVDEIAKRFTRSDKPLHDDLTMLVVQAAKSQAPLVKRRLRATAESLKEIRDVTREVSQEAGCGEDCTEQLVLAVNEACMNIIQHAYGEESEGEMVLDIRLIDNALEVRLTDFAEPMDLETVKPRPLEELRPGGLGTRFMSECMDEVRFVVPPPDGAGNQLWMRKRIA
ncbi:MAG: SpoIIE family protein phosphatase [Alphaproteobacteria bacterium]|mgnify:CR=1 FL=1|jgi:sigma-B regulation protein RsbU (phosphoserine phosphatase)|nr:SpoIIE family protein phosphatase [Alphaproteobacteria bacterium]MDP7233909.1 SpoIIE family protein phosphatase [Alphaproteobacteria bacterium]MDP7488221.1 SpoIIE family protein phosphatase [Alphaproteobacteria bacterium]|tara:strand:- start:1056 stop:2756 length:1701 start_codon:yes stop_codon:yes gene_type:complete